jgi:predicted nucleic acid-binding protein
MKYVLDASVALKWVLPEPDSPKAVRLRNGYRQQIHELLAPDIFTTEVGHTLARAERRNIIRPPQGMQRLLLILRMLPTLHSSLSLLPRAFQIASSMRVGVYDCLALAERESCELVTADDRLVRGLRSTFPFIVSLATMMP